MKEDEIDDEIEDEVENSEPDDVSLLLYFIY